MLRARKQHGTLAHPDERGYALDVTHFSWTLLLVLIVLPFAVIGLLKWHYRKRGGVDNSWGGALMISLCLLVGLVVILTKVWG